ncbi:MAG: hypothetical protein JJU36_16910 [Phycisphaeraceae bacterium]|nr:hypothetical protein [Phycisphaeraceae bacterium]
MMTSRQRVHATIDMTGPDRVPRDLWLLPAARLHYGDEAIDAFCHRWPLDITQCAAGRPSAQRPRGNPYEAGESIDDWGCVFENIIPGVHGEVKQPLLDDWSAMGGIQPPEELLEVDVDVVNAFCRASNQFVFASGWGRLFERMQFLRGSENLLMDIAEQSTEFFELLDLVDAFFLRQYQQWARTEVDALVLMDDWGGQQSLLIAPAVWRAIFKPRYAAYAAIAHESGKKFFMHSDGHISEIFEDLVEIGVDAINSQLFCMDIEEIGRRFAGRLCFWGEIDRQYILPEGSADEVRAAVKRVVDHLYRPEGGTIAQFSFEGDTRIENAQTAFEAWAELTAKKPEA